MACQKQDPCLPSRETGEIVIGGGDSYREKQGCVPVGTLRVSEQYIAPIWNATPVGAVVHRPAPLLPADRYAFAAASQTHRYMETIQHLTRSTSFRILSGMN
jgi:hypothetical protein